MRGVVLADAFPISPLARIIGIISLGLSVLMITVDQFIVNVSISTISGELGVSNNNGTWSITAYSVAAAMTIPLTGWLSTRFGWVRILAISIFLFTFFSWMCGLSNSLPMLIIMRLLQGACGGPLIPLGQSILLYLMPKNKPAAMGIFGLIIMVGPAVGPVLGGWLTFDYSWRLIFYVNIPLGILAGTLLLVTLLPIESKISKIPLDAIGFILFSLSIGALQIMLDKGYDYDWFKSNSIRILAILSIVSMIFLAIWESFHPHPMLHLKQLKSLNFTFGTIAISMAMLLCFSNLIVGPLWVQSQLGYTPEWAGFTLAPLGVTALICFPLVGIFMRYLDVRLWVLISFIILFISFFIQSRLTINTSFGYIGWSRAIMGVGFALFYVPLATITLGDIPNDELAHASGFFSSIRTVAMGMGISLGTNYWLRTSNFFQSRYAELMIPSNPAFAPYMALLKQKTGLEGEQANAFIYQILINQAQTECFFQLCYISGLWLIPTLCLLFFVKTRKGEHVPIE